MSLGFSYISCLPLSFIMSLDRQTDRKILLDTRNWHTGVIRLCKEFTQMWSKWPAGVNLYVRSYPPTVSRHTMLDTSTWESVSYVSDVSLNVTPPAALYKHSRKSNPSWIGKELRLAKEKCTFHAECSSYGWEARLTQGAKSQRATCCQSLENRTIERPVVLIDMRKGSTYGAERSMLRALEYGHRWCHDFWLYRRQTSGCINYV